MSTAFKSLSQLLAEGRPADWPVALADHDWVTWHDLAQLIDTFSATLPQTVILSDEHPLHFLARLLACIRVGRRIIIPPNFQDKTLAEMAALPTISSSTAIPCLEIYTSGTTGQPKMIPKTLRQLEAECRVLEDCWGAAMGRQTVVATTPYHHIYGLLFRLLWPLSAGRPFDLATAAEPANLKDRLNAAGESILVSSPAQLSRLPDLLALEQLTPHPSLVFSSGGPLRPDDAQRYREAWGSAPTEILGSTETGGIAWRRQSPGDSAWTPLPSVHVSQGDDGALILRSPFLPDDTPYRTADQISPDQQGRFQLHGRLDRIVKIAEKRLSLPEMEAWLASHPAVAAAALTAISSGTRQTIGAVLVLSSSSEVTRRACIDQLRSHLAERFDRVLLPRKWRFVKRLPYNERGKLATSDLLAILETPT